MSAAWGYSARRDNGYGGEVRLGLGAVATGRIWDFTVRPEQVEMLQNVWDEIGRCNAEWRAIAPLIAVSDVDTRVSITRSVPRTNAAGEPAVSASTLIAALDAVVVVVVNHNREHNNLRKFDDGIGGGLKAGRAAA